MKIVTDSSVMFSMEEGARRGMAVLPLVVAIDGQSWLEYEDVSAEEFLAKVRAGALPQSASPPPALTLKAYDTDEEVIHLAMADGCRALRGGVRPRQAGAPSRSRARGEHAHAVRAPSGVGLHGGAAGRTGDGRKGRPRDAACPDRYRSLPGPSQDRE